ncbi:Ku protein [Neorhizobium sp. NPDC001467]|uniref:non-homologous end joining protein Ku n=1 Tax=Neorhizobium sp. NPDC001467 TaxID=3390595 RepID=UPI003CFDB616
MTAARANWKGHLKFGEVSCPVALYSATSSADRISFNILNRKTGNRVRREFIDSETGDPVEHDDQVKGYEAGNGRYIVLEPEEIAAAIPDSDKMLAIEAFIACDEIDNVYFDRPYYLTPQKTGEEAFRLLCQGMEEANVAAIASTVLFRRLRTVLLRPHGDGLIATTLNFDYEVRSADKAFDDVSVPKVDKEMLDLAAHIIGTKKGHYDAGAFDDRYEEALAELVKVKIEGRPIRKRAPPKASKPSDLLQAFRESAGMGNAQSSKRKPGKSHSAKGKSVKPKSANANPPPKKTKPAAAKSAKSHKAAGSAQRKAG